MTTTDISPNLPKPILEKQPGVRHILDNTKYPDYIRAHAVFNKLDKITKVFPGIGLPNFIEECKYSNIVEARQDAQNLLYCDIRTTIYNAYCHSAHSTPINALLHATYIEIGQYHLQMILEEDGKLALKFINDVGTWGTKPFIKKGEGVFKAYNKLVEKVKEIMPLYNMAALDAMPNFKAFSATNVPGGRKLQVIFSSAGKEGAWDIATISMRGISSCQGWGTTQSRGLIGSISSKYVGVIYITGGEPFNEYGSKMIRRSMVRFAINKVTKKPALLLDKVYPGDDLAARTIFKKALESKVNIPILFPGDAGWADYCLPIDTYLTIAPLQTNEFTYMDTKIPWKNTVATVPNVALFYQRIAQLDTELAVKVHTTIIKMLDEYCINKKTHREQFRGGVANLLLSIKKHIGNHTGAIGHFLPKLYSVCCNTTILPKADQFSTAKEYERAVIKGVFKNMRVFDAQTKANCMQMGNFMSFFPSSSEKLIALVISEYKRELVNRYKDLISE